VAKPAEYYANNVAETLVFLDALVKAGVSNVVFSSTCAIYGVPSRIPIVEAEPKNPINPYGRGKLMVEQILEDFDTAYGLKSVCLRYFNAAGADPEGETGEHHDPETHLIPIVLETALGKRPAVPVLGNDYPTPDGTCVRDYIHVMDLAQAHVQAMEHLSAGKPSLRLNLGNGNGYSVLEVIEKARAITGRKIAADFQPRRAGDPPILVGSADKAREILGWRPKFGSLESILGTAWEWHRKRG
jgi:UDP-glucose 4-epimerase